MYVTMQDQAGAALGVDRASVEKGLKSLNHWFCDFTRKAVISSLYMAAISISELKARTHLLNIAIRPTSTPGQFEPVSFCAQKIADCCVETQEALKQYKPRLEEDSAGTYGGIVAIAVTNLHGSTLHPDAINMNYRMLEFSKKIVYWL